MSAAVTELYELPIFQKESKLIAGTSGLNNLVQNVSVMEVPDFNISGQNQGVFLLTTLYAYKDAPQQLLPALQRLFCGNNVAGIAIKLDRFLHQIPSEVIELADQCAIPLFVLSKNVTFRQMIIEITDKLIDNRSAILTAANNFSETLSNIVLNNRGISGVVNALYREISCYCACYSLNDNRLTESHTSDKSSLRDKCELLAEQLLKHKTSSKDATFFQLNDCLIFPCKVHRQIVGCLIIGGAEDLGEKEYAMVNQAVSFLSICFLEEYTRIEAEQRIISPIVNRLLFSTHTNREHVENDLRALGLKILDYFLVIAIESSPDSRAICLSGHSLVKFWQQKATQTFESAIVVPEGQTSVIIASGQKDNMLAHSTSWQGALEQIAKFGESVKLGYSVLIADPLKIPECYKQARKAICYGRKTRPDKDVFAYEDYLALGVVSQCSGTLDADILYNTIITPLLQYDCSHGESLWKTLETTLASKSLSQSAKDLYIHISTLRYRLEKICELTGCDFFCSQGKFKLNLAYMLYQSQEERS